ncbi:MAG: hypothetical protein OZ916_00130 [Nitrosomonas sp.]|uniref:hypothetical protein n=1 Tax=Nitrosomonas sp. TaxID=42353 RepID=UPI002B3E7497|nr:hypothetical protein [Nitrosomonas sp.]MEB2330675.1 hypothetical protein [Nitrosomonas sp.]
MTMTKSYYTPILLVAAGFVLTGCVTINIYFPAAAAEKVADKIIEEVWQTDGNRGKNDRSGNKPGNDVSDKTDSETGKTKP